MDYEKAINILERLKDKINGGRWVDIFSEDGGYLLALDLAISNLKIVEQCRWERDIATEQLHELGLGLGQKIDGVYLTHDKYNKLLEYKLMYEDLCK